MLKKTAAFLLLAILFCCSKDNNQPSNETPEPTAEDPVIEQPKEEEPPSIGNILEEDLILIDIELPSSDNPLDYKIFDNKGRSQNLNETLQAKIQKGTVVSLINKQTSGLIYVGYFSHNNESSAKSGITAKTDNINDCTLDTVLGATSSARYLLAQSLAPSLGIILGPSPIDSVRDIYETGLICAAYAENKVEEIADLIRDERDELEKVVQKEVFKQGISVVTGGLFSDCFDRAIAYLETGSIVYEGHPEEERMDSESKFKENSGLPYLVDSFNNTATNGVIIQSVEPIANSEKVDIKLKVYNSLPIPLGIRIGKLREGSNNIIEPIGDTKFIIGSDGNSIVQIFKNGITCEGFTQNAVDSYYTTVLGDEALRSSKFSSLEIELEFDPGSQYIVFEKPHENKIVELYHLIELTGHTIGLMSGLAGTITNTNSSEAEGLKLVKSKIILDLAKKLAKDPEVLNSININRGDYKRVIGIVGNAIQSLSEVVIKNIFKTAWEITGVNISEWKSNVKLYKLGLDAIDAGFYIDGFYNQEKYFPIDYEILVPGHSSNEMATVNNPMPIDGSVDIPTQVTISFNEANNTPQGVHYRFYIDTNQNLENIEGNDLALGVTSFTFIGQSSATYYWKVQTISSAGEIMAESPTWNFTTKGITSGGVYEGDVDLTNQFEVDEFGVNNYSEINGSLTIKYNSGAIIENLNSLSTILKVSGSLIIEQNPDLLSLEGLYQLEQADFVTIQENPSLLSIIGFQSLNLISGAILIRLNNAVTSIDIMNSTSIQQPGLSIIGNTSAITIKAFDLVPSSSSSIIMRTGSTETTTISGFSNITSINGSLNIRLMEGLDSLNSFQNLTTITGELWIDQLAVLNTNMFQNLESIGSGGINEFKITNNNMLNDFCGFNKLINSGNLNLTQQIIGNAYNPTIQDLIDGKCSQ